MYCSSCGRKSEDNEKFCAACGTSLDWGPVDAALAEIRRVGALEGHVRVLGVFWLVVSSLTVISAIVMLLFASWLLAFIPTISLQVRGFIGWFGILTGLAVVAAGIVGLGAAWGLLARRNWARTLLIVLALLVLLYFPIGTVLGAYTLWVLLPAGAEYRHLCGVT